MEEEKTYAVRYVALDEDIVRATVEAKSEEEAIDKVWEECSCGSSNDPLKIIDVE